MLKCTDLQFNAQFSVNDKDSSKSIIYTVLFLGNYFQLPVSFFLYFTLSCPGGEKNVLYFCFTNIFNGIADLLDTGMNIPIISQCASF